MRKKFAEVVLAKDLQKNCQGSGRKYRSDFKRTQGMLFAIYESLTMLDAINAEKILNGETLKGQITGKPFDAERLKLRSKIFNKEYPTYKDFANAVAEKVGLPPNTAFTSLQTECLRARYIAPDEAVISKLYESLNIQQDELNMQHIKLKSPKLVAEFMYKT